MQFDSASGIKLTQTEMRFNKFKQAINLFTRIGLNLNIQHNILTYQHTENIVLEKKLKEFG